MDPVDEHHCRSLRLAMDEDQRVTVYVEEHPVLLASMRGTDFIETATEPVDSWFSNRPLPLNPFDVGANFSSYLLGLRQEPVPYWTSSDRCPVERHPQDGARSTGHPTPVPKILHIVRLMSRPPWSRRYEVPEVFGPNADRVDDPLPAAGAGC